MINPVPMDGAFAPAARPAAKPSISIRSTTGWQNLNLREIWQYRDLLMTLASRDVKLRYRQTALGAAWVVFQPLLGAGIFSFVFGKVANLPSDGVPYFLFSYAGLLGWNVFNGTLGKASGSLVSNSHLVQKVFFPRLILPLSTVFSTLIDFLVAFVMLLVMMATVHMTPHWQIILLPVFMLLLTMLAVGMGLYVAAQMVTYRDIGYVMPVLLQFLLYASPVAYSVSKVPAAWRTLYFANPISGLIEGFRWSVLGRGHVHWGAVLYSTVCACLVLVIGAFSFKKMEKRFADVI